MNPTIQELVKTKAKDVETKFREQLDEIVTDWKDSANDILQGLEKKHKEVVNDFTQISSSLTLRQQEWVNKNLEILERIQQKFDDLKASLHFEHLEQLLRQIIGMENQLAQHTETHLKLSGSILDEVRKTDRFDRLEQMSIAVIDKEIQLEKKENLHFDLTETLLKEVRKPDQLNLENKIYDLLVNTGKTVDSHIKNLEYRNNQTYEKILLYMEHMSQLSLSIEKAQKQNEKRVTELSQSLEDLEQTAPKYLRGALFFSCIQVLLLVLIVVLNL